MASNNGTQVGSGFIRVAAKVLDADYQEFKRKWRQGIEHALQGVTVDHNLVSPQAAQQAGSTAGTHIVSGATSSVSSGASQVTQPIASTGNSVGRSFGTALVSGVIAAKTGQLVGKALGVATELNSTQNNLQAQLGLTPQQAKKYGAITGDLYAKGYGESLDEVQDSIAAVLSSIPGMKNASNSAVESMTEKVLTLSQAFGIDAGKSTKVLGEMISSGLVKDASEGADLLTSTFQNVPADVREDILDAADEYSPFFKSLGIEGQQAFNLLTKASAQGMYGIDKTGDALKEFTIRSTDMSTSTQAAYKTLGLSAQDYTKKLLAGGPEAEQAFQTIVTGLQNIKDPATQANTALSLFGTPLEDLGTQKIPGFLSQLTNTKNVLGEVKGSSDKASNSLSNSMGNSLEVVQRQFNITLGKIALPLLQAILPIVKSIASFLTANSDLIAKIGGPLLVVSGVITSIVFALSAYQTVAGILAPLIGGLTTAQIGFNAALFVNPLTIWIIALTAVIGLVIVLATHWKQFTDFIASSINAIGQFFDWLADKFSSIFPGLSKLLGISNGGGYSSGGNFGGAKKYANGGLIPATPGGSFGIFGEAGQNEIVQNEGLYNKNTKAVTQMVENTNKNMTTNSGGNKQENHFHGTDPNAAYTILTTKWKQQNGF